MDKENTRFSRWWGIIVGTGISLSPIHNMRLTQWMTNDAGETLFFLPAFGYLLWIMGTGLFLLHHWEQVKANGLGDKRIWIPLLVIVGAIGLSGIPVEGWQAKFAPLGMGGALFALYLMARIVGKDLFMPVAVGVAVGSLGIIAHQIVYPGQTTGGFVFERNFDIATGYILLGAALFVHQWRWQLACLSIIALLLSGAPEAVFALGVVALFGLFRKEWSVKRLVPLVSVLVILVSAGLATGHARQLYSYVNDTLTHNPVAHYSSPDGDKRTVSTLAIRYLVIKDALSDIRPLGEGYNLTAFRVSTVHNVPLVLVQQMGYPGILAGIAWLWVSVWCLVKTRWKYAWVAVLALSVFDHYLWTQIGHWWWAIIGASIASNIPDDFVFRDIENGNFVSRRTI